MTKLKTLKDLKEEDDTEPFFYFGDDLKAEAIKWHKEFKKMKRLITIEDWELFFDITEEDLK